MEQVYHYFWLGFYQILSFGVASDTKGGSIAGFRSIHHWDLNPQRGCNTKRLVDGTAYYVTLIFTWIIAAISQRV